MPISQSITQSKTLVIAATGINGKFGMPEHAFFKAAGLARHSRIVLSDPTCRCCLGGLSAECPTFSALVGYLRDEVARLAVDRVITTGNTMGGHSALLLGHLLNADYAVAFGPATYVSKGEIRRRRDPKLLKRSAIVETLDRLPQSAKQYMDLRPVLEKYNGITRYYVHASRYNETDRHRAMYLEGLPNLEVVLHPYVQHSVGPMLAKEGRLKDCYLFPYKRDYTLAMGLQRCKGAMGFWLNKARRKQRSGRRPNE
jgi:hypothetical protein